MYTCILDLYGRSDVIYTKFVNRKFIQLLTIEERSENRSLTNLGKKLFTEKRNNRGTENWFGRAVWLQASDIIAYQRRQYW